MRAGCCQWFALNMLLSGSGARRTEGGKAGRPSTIYLPIYLMLVQSTVGVTTLPMMTLHAEYGYMVRGVGTWYMELVRGVSTHYVELVRGVGAC